MKQFAQNKDGVHLIIGELSLCGETFDEYSDGMKPNELIPTKAKYVTCQFCSERVKACRGVKIGETNKSV